MHMYNMYQLLGSPPPRSRSPLASRAAYSPPRDRIRDYSPGSRRPAPYDTSRGAPPMKRSRPDDMMSSRPMRDGGPRGIVREAPLREASRGMSREGGRGGMSSFRR